MQIEEMMNELALNNQRLEFLIRAAKNDDMETIEESFMDFLTVLSDKYADIYQQFQDQ